MMGCPLHASASLHIDHSSLGDRELKDVCSLIDDHTLVEIVSADDPPKPFSAFGSYRQRHGDALSNLRRSSLPARCKRDGSSGLSSEAPAKLGSGACPGQCSSQERLEASELTGRKKEQFSPSVPINISSERTPSLLDSKVPRILQSQRSFTSDIDRDEAWERKRDLFSMDEVGGVNGRMRKTVARSVSDCGDRTWPRPCGDLRSRTRTRSLTDEDLEELRGCIDLGFGFSYDDSCTLKSTLPALELYCAINKQYVDIKSRSSPVSPLDRGMLDRTSSGGSPCSPGSDSWRISSPGDNPSQVKTRLRHWAQAVACSVKQGIIV